MRLESNRELVSSDRCSGSNRFVVGPGYVSVENISEAIHLPCCRPGRVVVPPPDENFLSVDLRQIFPLCLGQSKKFLGFPLRYLPS